MTTCQARRSRDGESMECGHCGLQWDVNDTDRPPCRTSKEVGLKALHDMREGLEADIVHKCNNCSHDHISYCDKERWTSGEGVNRDRLQVLRNVDNSDCPYWGFKL